MSSGLIPSEQIPEQQQSGQHIDIVAQSAAAIFANDDTVPINNQSVVTVQEASGVHVDTPTAFLESCQDLDSILADDIKSECSGGQTEEDLLDLLKQEKSDANGQEDEGEAWESSFNELFPDLI